MNLCCLQLDINHPLSCSCRSLGHAYDPNPLVLPNTCPQIVFYKCVLWSLINNLCIQKNDENIIFCHAFCRIYRRMEEGDWWENSNVTISDRRADLLISCLISQSNKDVKQNKASIICPIHPCFCDLKLLFSVCNVFANLHGWKAESCSHFQLLYNANVNWNEKETTFEFVQLSVCCVCVWKKVIESHWHFIGTHTNHSSAASMAGHIWNCEWIAALLATEIDAEDGGWEEEQQMVH